MTIKGIQTRAAVLGHIKIGGRKKVKTRDGIKIIPAKFDHFVVTTNQQDEMGYILDDVLMRKLLVEQEHMIKAENTEHIYNPAGQLQKSIQYISDKRLQELNEKLRQILVALPFDDINSNLVTSISVYDREGCRCRGDGETADWIDPKTGETTKVRCPCGMLQVFLNDDDEPDTRPQHDMADRGMKPNEKNGFLCKANGVLRVKIAAARTLGGVHLFRTTSINSIRQLLSAMQEVSDITGGILVGIPLNLQVEPKRVSPGANKKPQIVHVVNLTYKASAIEILRAAIEQTTLREQMKKQLASKEIAELPAPGHENRYEQVAIAQEFYSGHVPVDYIDIEEEPEKAKDQEAAPQDEEAPDPEDSRYDYEDPPPMDTDRLEFQEEDNSSTEDSMEVDKDESEVDKDKSEVDKDEAPQKAADKTREKDERHPQDSDAEQQMLHGRDPEENSPDTPPESGDGQETQDSEKPDPTDEATASPGNEEGSNGFPRVIVDKPEGATSELASKELRKGFIVLARKKGHKDADVRDWIEKLWGAKTSAVLKTWQVNAMNDALNK